jgi:CheY-like chemotaxis protein
MLTRIMASAPQFPIATPLDMPAGPMGTGTSGRRRVTVIDDNARDIELFVIACDLGNIPVDVTGYAGGAAAMAALTAAAAAGDRLPAVIMLDLNMPGMNGFDVLAALKTHAVLSSVPVVILTSSDSPKDREQCRRMGANGYLVKPSTIKEFVLMLQAALPASPV